MTVFLVQPVSSFSAAVSWVMVRGLRSHRRFISFHSLPDRLIFIGVLPSSNRYTSVYL